MNANVSLGNKSWDTVKPELNPKILDLIRTHFKFTTMSPVQENAIPQLLSHKDVVVEACTGSGKTLAYLVPVFNLLLEKQKTTKLQENSVYVLIICPTRELAEQVAAVADIFSNATGITVQRVIGGQEVKFVGHIAVCTPGRLLDVLKSRQSLGHGVFEVKNLDMLILDEADRILDMGFERQVDQILGLIPKQRRTGLFSATQTNHMEDLIRSGLRNPVKVQVKVVMKNAAQQATPLQLTNYYIICHEQAKLSQLVYLLQTLGSELTDVKMIVYFATCACVDFFHKVLIQLLRKQTKSELRKMQLYALHGQMVQKRRTKTYEEFLEDSGVKVMLCTDVAARGLDFPNINYIIQYDPPVDPNSFIHRVGRTARMGKSGVSIVFLANHEDNYVEYLQLKKVPIQEMKAVHVLGVNDVKKQDQMDEDDEEDKEERITVENVLPKVQEMVLQDRDLVEKGSEAFLSYVRAYKEHQLNYIFKFANLRYGRLIKAFALVTLPKLRELKKQNISLSEEFANIDVDAIPYKDPQREKARQLRLQKKLQEKVEQEEKQKVDKEKSLSQKKMEIRKATDLRSKNKKRIYQYLEMEEMRKEKNLMKLLRNGKITEEEYEQLSGEADFEQALMNGVLESSSGSGNKKKKQKLEGFVSSIAQQSYKEESQQEETASCKKKAGRHKKKKR